MPAGAVGAPGDVDAAPTVEVLASGDSADGGALAVNGDGIAAVDPA